MGTEFINLPLSFYFGVLNKDTNFIRWKNHLPIELELRTLWNKVKRRVFNADDGILT